MFMFKVELHDTDAIGDPAPRFATDAEIRMAAWLRHQLEERYLAPRVARLPSPPRSSEGDH
jgi:hypothetical protein